MAGRRLGGHVHPELRGGLSHRQHRGRCPGRLHRLGHRHRLTLSGENLRDTFNDHVRSTTAFGQSEPLDWASRPLSGFLQGHLIDLAGYEPDLPEGRWLAISGLVLADLPANAKARNRLAKGDALASIRSPATARRPNSNSRIFRG
jgi:hypothetical protein